MTNNIGAFRKIIGDYFFENDESGTINVYNNDNLEHFDTIEIGYKYDFDEFEFLCNEWLEKNE